MKRTGLCVLATLAGLAVAPIAVAGGIVQLALPTQQPDAPPLRPVGDPDQPPISIDFFQIEEIFVDPQPLEPASR